MARTHRPRPAQAQPTLPGIIARLRPMKFSQDPHSAPMPGALWHPKDHGGGSGGEGEKLAPVLLQEASGSLGLRSGVVVCAQPARHLPQFLEPGPQRSSGGHRLPRRLRQDGCLWAGVRHCFQKDLHKGRAGSRGRAGTDGHGCPGLRGGKVHSIPHGHVTQAAGGGFSSRNVLARDSGGRRLRKSRTGRPGHSEALRPESGAPSEASPIGVEAASSPVRSPWPSLRV